MPLESVWLSYLRQPKYPNWKTLKYISFRFFLERTDAMIRESLQNNKNHVDFM